MLPRRISISSCARDVNSYTASQGLREQRIHITYHKHEAHIRKDGWRKR
jgi:hypothetical protein